MNLNEHYSRLYKKSIQQIKDHGCHSDPHIDDDSDNRYGLTLLIRPDEHVKEKTEILLRQLREVEPQQYYYPATDFHITVMSIISCYSGFNPSHINLADYIHLINQSIAGIQPFKITFKGITASPSCLMTQGFPLDETLNKLRNNLRTLFGNSQLEQSLDKRYTLQTAHSTVVRFRQPLTQPEKFLKILEKHKNTSFGSFTVNQLELVFNDWYLRHKKVQKVGLFRVCL